MAVEFHPAVFGFAVFFCAAGGPIYAQSDSLWAQPLSDRPASEMLTLEDRWASWDTSSLTDTYSSIESWKAQQLDTIARHTGTDLFVASRIRRLLLRHPFPKSPLEWKAYDFLTKNEMQRLMAIDPKVIGSISALGKRRRNNIRGRTLWRWTRKWRSSDQRYALSPLSHLGSAYLGDPNHLLVQTRLQQGRELVLALCMEKDAGEPFDDQLFDHWSGFIAWTPKNGLLRQLILGSFHVQWAQGLSLWSGSQMDFRSASDPMWNGRGVTPYSGAMEMLHLKGLAGRWRWQDWRLELVGSRRYLNGSFEEDSGPRVDISGYNRTPNERMHRSSLQLDLFGGYLRWTRKHQRLGLICRSQLLSSRTEPHRQTEQVLAAEYLLQWKKNRLYAEVGIKSTGGRAWILGSHLPLLPRMHFGLHVRKISNHYPSSTSRLYERTTDHGLFEQELRIKADCSARLNLDGFILLRQSLDPTISRAPQQMGIRGYLTIRPDLNISFGIQQRAKGTIETSDEASGPSSISTQFIQRDQTLSERVQLRSRIGIVHSDRSLLPKGGLFFQEFIYRTEQLKAAARLTGFSIPDHAHRIYAYRTDVRYGFSVPAYYGQGAELHILMGFKKRGWLLEARYTYRKINGILDETELRMQLIRSF